MRTYFIKKTNRGHFTYSIVDSSQTPVAHFCTRIEGIEKLDILVNEQQRIPYTDGIDLFYLIEHLPIPYTKEIGAEANFYDELKDFRNAVLFQMLDTLAHIERVQKRKTEQTFLFIYPNPPYFCLLYEKEFCIKTFSSKEQAVTELQYQTEKERLLRVLNKYTFPKSQITRDFFLQNIDN